MVKTLEALQTISISYREILAGEDPWIALGNFMNDFFGNYPDRRTELVREPLQVPTYVTPEEHRWTVFCAATVEHLCQKYELACPAWVHNPAYSLAEPWYYAMGAHKPHVRARLERETPEPFARRNIYCGNRMFVNKYELAAERLQLQPA
jgi:hypothetical protein